MGIVYGRMIGSSSDRDHTSCSPSKARPLSRAAGGASSTRRLQILDDADNSSSEGDHSPEARRIMTRQSSRLMANQRDSAGEASGSSVRRSARLTRSSGSGSRAASFNSPAPQASALNLTSRLRRSARIARIGTGGTSRPAPASSRSIGGLSRANDSGNNSRRQHNQRQQQQQAQGIRRSARRRSN